MQQQGAASDYDAAYCSRCDYEIVLSTVLKYIPFYYCSVLSEKSSHPWQQTDILLSKASQNVLLGTPKGKRFRLRHGRIFPLNAVIPLMCSL